MSRLEGKVVFISGAASGIGKEIALELAREGAKIIIADLNQQGAEDAATEAKNYGSKAIGIAIDVTDETQVEAYTQTAINKFGNIYMGPVHSKEAPMLKAPYVTAKHCLIGLAKTVAKEGSTTSAQMLYAQAMSARHWWKNRFLNKPRCWVSAKKM